MARIKRKKTVAFERFKEPQTKKIFNGFKFTESYTSLALGAIAVIIIGIIIFSFARGNRNSQTSSTNEGPETEQSNTSSTYTIKPGDDLWSISQNVYSDGYKWVEIAKVNKLENPGLIHVGNKLFIPKVEKAKMVKQGNKPASESNKIITNSAISGVTYTIKEGDNLWDISVRAYGDGFKWPELAKVNNISNPDLIFPNNVLKIPR